MSRRIGWAVLGAAIALSFTAPAFAQTKLKWAHVYETPEPYHVNALWAAEEIKKRTNGRYEVQVFPASQLGNENQINEVLNSEPVSGRFKTLLLQSEAGSPQQAATFIARETQRWADVIRKAGVQPH